MWLSTFSLFLFLSAVRMASADPGPMINGDDYCGYGKVVSVGLATDSENRDWAAVVVEGMPNTGQYGTFRGRSVIGMKRGGGGAPSRELFSLKFGALVEALASGATVRILHNTSDGASLKCNASIDMFEIRICALGKPCWGDAAGL
jgi:hypothetical protein